MDRRGGAGASSAGETGIARPGFDLARVTVQEVTHGREETLRRWLHLDTGARSLAIITTGPGGLREHTPGEIADQLLHNPTTDDARLTQRLADRGHILADAPPAWARPLGPPHPPTRSGAATPGRPPPPWWNCGAPVTPSPPSPDRARVPPTRATPRPGATWPPVSAP
ncbi:hypothetical protein [Streptomyces viridosporus]|uniref:hypothetical protein n=1 Tax=Streptomyces viridosporus TaxID=67581 RepID=UPI00332A1D65